MLWKFVRSFTCTLNSLAPASDAVLLYELLHSRQSFRCGVAGDNDDNTSSLAVFELTPDVRIFVFREIDRSGSVKPDARRGIVRQRSLLLLRIRREMIFHLLRIQRRHIELLHEADHLRPTEVLERVAGQAQSNRRCFVSGWAFLSQCEDVARSSERCRYECTGASEITAGQSVFHRAANHKPSEA